MSSNKAFQQALKLQVKERGKTERLAKKEKEKTERLAKKEKEKTERLAKKEKEKVERSAKKEKEKVDKLVQKEKEKAERSAEKEREKAEKLITQTAFKSGIKEGKKQEKIIQKNKLQRKSEKFDITKKAISNLVQVAKLLSSESLNNPHGYHMRDIVEAYIRRFGLINPYTTEPADLGYDVSAAIRGIVYESSPSSLQHWFRFGQRKGTQQICPWIFANKKIAIINNNYGWGKTNENMIYEKKNRIGLWKVIKENNPQFDWNNDIYGPLPTESQLEHAENSGERLIGKRNH